MPSILADMVSESVALASSDVSPYEPPHRTSQEKPSRRSSGTNGAILNGFTVDESGLSKIKDGVLYKGSKGANASLHSLPNGRPSDSMDGWEKTHSRSGSEFSIATGSNGSGEAGRRSPALARVLSKQTAAESITPAAQTNGIAVQPSRPKSPEKGQIGSGPRRHTRTHSSSAPQSHSPYPIALSNKDATTQASTGATTSTIDSLPPNRFSAPPNPPSATSHHPGPSSSSLHPPASQLQHRHTLQVPRTSTSRTSREYTSPVKTSSEGADGEYERFSPSHGGERGSTSLGRRPTRSIQSDMLLDEIAQDGDMARWTETIRQKRASRRQRKEEEEDDRVVVGTKVDMHHVNWVTAYNMLTGIRFTVSRTNAKLDRDLTDADFDARHKFSFDM